MIKESFNNEAKFSPRFFIKNQHIQSFLASARFLAPFHHALLANSVDVIIETKQKTKLLACISRLPDAKGIFIIIHGWEGSSASAYVLAASSFFYKLGFTVCRLNLRDHGESHHLNEGLFHGALLDETFDAVNYLASISENILPVYLLGFSLGANFSLRIAIEHSRNPIRNLKKVFAVSPPMDPYKTTLAIDNGPSFYRKYFLKKWKRSLRKKQGLFPHLYRFEKILKAKTCMELTADILAYYPEFPSYRDYFNLYTLRKKSFDGLNVPVKIFIAADDPVIPLDDFADICETDYLTISRQFYGGHCGFINLFPYQRWHQERIADELLK
jgi:predicted alpha/beta-fold hydrolase